MSPEMLRLTVQPSTTCWACSSLMLASILAVRVRKPEPLDLSKG